MECQKGLALKKGFSFEWSGWSWKCSFSCKWGGERWVECLGGEGLTKILEVPILEFVFCRFFNVIVSLVARLALKK